MGGMGGMGGLGGGMQQQDQMRMMQMMQEMQMVDSLRMYNELVERCFGHCVESFRSRKLDGKEVCPDFITGNMLAFHKFDAFWRTA